MIRETDEKPAGYGIDSREKGAGMWDQDPPPLPSRPWKYYSIAGNNLSTLNKGVNTATRASLGEAPGVCDDFQETCQIL